MVSWRAETLHRLCTIFAALDGAVSGADEDDDGEDVSSQEDVDYRFERTRRRPGEFRAVPALRSTEGPRVLVG